MVMLPDVDQSSYDEYERQRVQREMDQKMANFALEHAIDTRIADINAVAAPPVSSDSLTNPLGTGNVAPAALPSAPAPQGLPSPELLTQPLPEPAPPESLPLPPPAPEPAPVEPVAEAPVVAPPPPPDFSAPPPAAPPAPPAATQPTPAPAAGGDMDSWVGGALGAVRRAGGDVQKFADGLNTSASDLVGNALGAANRAGADLQAFAANLPPPPAPPAAAPAAAARGGTAAGPAAQAAGVPGWLNDLIARNAPGDLASDPDFIRTVAAGAKAESGWDPNRVQNGFSMGSGKGARGLFQFDMGGMGAGIPEEQLLGQQGAEMQASRIIPLYAKAYQSAPAGLSGAEKASWVAAQAERPRGYDDPSSGARRNYASAFNEIGGAVQGAAGAVGSAVGGAVSAVGSAARGAVNQISQFGDSQLSSDEAYAACGPAAAVRFASMYGRNPSLREATDLARSVGWTPGSGMAGLTSEKALMDKIGVPTKMVDGAQWDQFAREAQSGNPVTISTPGHYYFADGFDPTSGAFHVGRSGTDLKGGSEWMTPAQMEARMGKVQGGLLADNPQVPAPSTADQDSNPLSYAGRLKDTLASSITSGAPAAPAAPDLTDIYGKLTSAATGRPDDLVAASVGQAALAATPSSAFGASAITQPTEPTPPQNPADRLKSAFGDFIDSVGGAKDALGSAAGNLIASPGGGMPAAAQPTPSDSLTNPTGTRYTGVPEPTAPEPSTGPTGLGGLLDRAGQLLPDITGTLTPPAAGSPLDKAVKSGIGNLPPVEQVQALQEWNAGYGQSREAAIEAVNPARDVPLVGGLINQLTDPEQLALIALTGPLGEGAGTLAGGGVRGAVANQALQGAAANAGYVAAQGGTPEQIAEAALTGGVLGGGTAAAPGLARAGAQALQNPEVQAALRTRQRAEGVNPFSPPPPIDVMPTDATPVQRTTQDQASSRLREIREMFDRQDRQPSLISRVGERAADILGLGGRTGELDTAVADRFAAINQITGRARQALGDNFTPEMDAEAYTAAYMGRGGRAAQVIKDEVMPALDVVRPPRGVNDVENLNVYRKAQRDMEVANLRGGTRTASAGVDSVETAQATLNELQAEVGPQRWAAIERADQMLNQAQERLLEQRVQAGLIDRDLAEQLLRDHPHYNPTVVMKYEDGSGVSAGRTVLQTTGNKVRQLAEDGSKDDTEKPLRSLIRHFVENDVLVNRNETARSIIRAAQADPSLAGEVQRVNPMRRVTGPEVAGPGGAAEPGTISSVMQRRFGDQPGEMSLYEDGKRVYYSIPEGLEAAVKGLDAQGMGAVERILNAANKPLRFGATAASPPFLVTNALADAVTTYVREGPGTAARIPAGWWAAAKQNDLYKDYIRAGGSMESLFQKSPRDLDKLVEDTGGLIARNPSDIARIAKDAVRLQWIRRAGEVIEQGPRLAAFERHLARGESPTQAAVYGGRRSTVDFARGGDAIKQANAVSLFLNARVQGSLNMARTLRDDPKGAGARVASLAAMTAGAYAYNRQFPEYWDVPRDVRDNSMVFMLPGSEKDPNGPGYKRLNYISVPLREWSVFTAPINYALSKIDQEHGDDPRTWQDFTKNEASTLSPVTGEDAGTGAGSLLPAPARYALENATNTRFRSGSPIIPSRYQELPPSQQWDDRTSLLGRKLGETLGISPMGFDFLVNENLGGLGRTTLGASDQVTNWVTQARGGEVPATGRETPAVIGGLLSGAVRTYGGQIAKDRYDKLDQLVGQFQEPVAAAVRQSPEYSDAPRDRQDSMVLLAQQELKSLLQDELGIQPRGRDLGLPDKYLSVVDDPQREREIDDAISRFNAWDKDPRNNPRPNADELRLALRYKDLVSPRYTLEKQRMEQRNAGLRSQVADTLATARGG